MESIRIFLSCAYHSKKSKDKKEIPIAKVRKWYENKVGVMNSEIQRE